MKKPLCIDLFCGLGGWAEGFLAEGWDVIGFDVERHDYGSGGYPAQLVLQDVLTLNGEQFADADCIVASPPCQFFSHRAMPWGKLWREHARMDDDGAPAGNYRCPDPYFTDHELRLFRECFRIQTEASAMAARHIPMVVENVCGAQRFIGPAAWHFGSYYLWGDVPALMPLTFACKVPSVSGRRTAPGNGVRFTSRDSGIEKGFSKVWRESPNGMPMMSSKSSARKAASAQIARIPFRLAQHIARVYTPQPATRT